MLLAGWEVLIVGARIWIFSCVLASCGGDTLVSCNKFPLSCGILYMLCSLAYSKFGSRVIYFTFNSVFLVRSLIAWISYRFLALVCLGQHIRLASFFVYFALLPGLCCFPALFMFGRC